MKKKTLSDRAQSKKKNPASENQGKKISAASCDIIRKVDKPQNRFVHRQSTGKKIQAAHESPTPPITFLMVLTLVEFEPMHDLRRRSPLLYQLNYKARWEMVFGN